MLSTKSFEKFKFRFGAVPLQNNPIYLTMDYPWGHQRRFNAYVSYFQRERGTRLQKISIDAGFSCPNRDGTVGTGGCTFCRNDAFNPSYCQPEKSITQQINEGIEFHHTRYRRADGYIAYFQAFSNTYAKLELLQKLYGEALAHPLVEGISIGTRPDCMSDEILDYLREVSRTKLVNVEFGVESCYDNTLERINRGHTFAQARDAIERTARAGLHAGGHFIFGLPGESMEDMLAEAPVISALPLKSVKFHQLQILKGTPMEKENSEKPWDFVKYSLEAYIDFIVDFLERFNPDIMIERLSGEVPPRYLAAHGWGLIRNDQVLQKIEQRLLERDTWQGKYFLETPPDADVLS